MAKGDNPNSRANLRHLTSEEAREIGRKGGKKSAEVRRYMSDSVKCLKELATDQKLEDAMNALLKSAAEGNVAAIKILLDYCAEKGKDNNDIRIVIGKDDFDAWSI